MSQLGDGHDACISFGGMIKDGTGTANSCPRSEEEISSVTQTDQCWHLVAAAPHRSTINLRGGKEPTGAKCASCMSLLNVLGCRVWHSQFGIGQQLYVFSRRGASGFQERIKATGLYKSKSCLTSHVLLSPRSCECFHHGHCLGFNSRCFKLAMLVT